MSDSIQELRYCVRQIRRSPGFFATATLMIALGLAATFGSYGLIQRCREHKRRNVLEHLPQAERMFVSRKLNKAWSESDAKRAETRLRALAKHLEIKHPGAAASLLEELQDRLGRLLQG